MDPDIKWGSDMDPSASILSKSAPCDIRLSVDVDAAAAVAMEVGHTLRMQILDSVVPLGGRGTLGGNIAGATDGCAAFVVLSSTGDDRSRCADRSPRWPVYVLFHGS